MDTVLNFNIGVLGHVDSGKTSLSKVGLTFDILPPESDQTSNSKKTINPTIFTACFISGF